MNSTERDEQAQHAIAHYRPADTTAHSLQSHLTEVAFLAAKFARPLGCEAAGELIGILHDYGKYSADFQHYIRSAEGLIDPGEEEWVDAGLLRGQIDHSSAGAQRIWRALGERGDEHARRVAQVLALCVASHHGGLIDCVHADDRTPAADAFAKRMAKPDAKTHLPEVERVADEVIRRRVDALLADGELVEAVRGLLERIEQGNPSGTTRRMQQGLATRLLFSGLIDADRISTADFKHEGHAKRPNGAYVPWAVLSERLERHLARLTAGPSRPIDSERSAIADALLTAIERKPGGIHLLSVPTGGGKTLASLRFALRHAERWELDRIVYVLPFTSIIDQNAAIARAILEPGDTPQDSGHVVLEHHSNLVPARDTSTSRLLSENWDAPVVFTTMVQFLEACFGGGTRGARRMHQLMNAVVVFDEVQALPVRCTHLFANAVNLLAEQAHSTIVFSTATQPLLDRVDASKGAVRLHSDPLVPDVPGLWRRFKRVEVRDDLAPRPPEEVAKLAVDQMKESRHNDTHGSCLVVANTRGSARQIYEACASLVPEDQLFFLSGDMCPAHRRKRLGFVEPDQAPPAPADTIRGRLERGLPTLCVSTQVIEAGVDVDFDAVVRCLAGLDSIAQAAGRCNRHGRRNVGRVTIVELKGERLKSPEDIVKGAEATERVVRDFNLDPNAFDSDLLGPKAMDRYYHYYFFERKDVMSYPVETRRLGRTDTLLNLLSTNTKAVQDLRANGDRAPFLPQSFRTAGELFEAIAPTDGVIVPFGEEGAELVSALRRAADDPRRLAPLMRRAQSFSVSVFPAALRQLSGVGAVEPLNPGLRVYVLSQPEYYSDAYGLGTSLFDQLLNGV